MDYMMYLPKVDDDAILIRKRVRNLGYWSNLDDNFTSKTAFNELLGMGRYITGHLLNAWENPPIDRGENNYNIFIFAGNLNRLLVAMIERGDLNLEQLQRYRRLITAEKKQ